MSKMERKKSFFGMERAEGVIERLFGFCVLGMVLFCCGGGGGNVFVQAIDNPPQPTLDTSIADIKYCSPPEINENCIKNPNSPLDNFDN